MYLHSSIGPGSGKTLASIQIQKWVQKYRFRLVPSFGAW